MENRTINIAAIAEVAAALKELKEQMVFVGGAVVSLYADDPAANEIRPTQDIDMTVKLFNFSKWANLQEQLAQHGFHPNPFGHAICSYRYKDIPIDIMAAADGPLGPSNRWYKLGFDKLQTVEVKGETIQILPAPCYLATKFEAFNHRGRDYRTSHDIEDVIYVIDNRMDIVQEVQEIIPEIRIFIQHELQKIIDQNMLDEVLTAHIHPIMLDVRLPFVGKKIQDILSL